MHTKFEIDSNTLYESYLQNYKLLFDLIFQQHTTPKDYNLQDQDLLIMHKKRPLEVVFLLV